MTTWNKSNAWQPVQTRSGYLVIGQTVTATDSQSLSSVVWQSEAASFLKETDDGI